MSYANKNTDNQPGKTSLAKKAILCAAVTQVLSTPAYAQLEEIIVTAQKREQSINDVSLSINAVQGDRLRTLGLDDAIDLDLVLTNVDIKSTISGAVNPIVSIRGVGLNSAASNNNPSVGIYVDEVFLSSPALLSMFMMDIGRVETLKGPQGTLYGRNSSGGAINIHSALPTQEPTGFIDISAGNYETVKFEGAYSRGITENVAGRISVLYEDQGESYYTNDTTGKDLDGIEKMGIRGTLQGSFDSTDVILRAYYFEQDGSNTLAEPVGTALAPFTFTQCPPAAALVASGRGDEFAPGQCVDNVGNFESNRDRFENILDPEFERLLEIDTDVTGVNLKIQHDFTDSLSLTSITAYMTQDRLFGDGADVLFILHDEELDQISQEFRLGGEFGEHSFIVGAFYSNDEVEMFNPFTSPLFAGQGLDPMYHTVDQETDAWAVFASMDWHLSDQLTLTTGIRYTDEEQTFVGGTTALFAGGPLSTLEDVINNKDLAQNPALGFPLTFTDDKIDETDTSYRIALEYRPNDDSLYYGSISTAFKSGGFYGDFTTEQEQLTPFEPEKITAYEVGTKLTLLDGLVQLNAAVFYYDYEDIQTQVPGSFSFVYSNVEEAEIYGLDFEVFASPIDNLDLRLGIGLVESEFVSDLAIYDGNSLANAPESQVTGGIRYQFAVAESLTLSLEADFKYSDDKYTEGTNNPLNYTDSYLISNARTALAPTNESWEFALWVRNLSDEDFREEAFYVEVAQTIFTFPTNPRTYGATFSYKF